jgi:hydrogenase maturation protease
MRDLPNEAGACPTAPGILVIGLGNYLLRDEGVGVHAVGAFQKDCPDGVCAVDAGTAVLRVENLLRSARLVIAFDAMQAGGPPGSVYAAGASGAAAGQFHVSLHEFGLLEALKAVPDNPPETLILGVEPGTIDYGCELSPAVQAAIPRVLAFALAAIGYWRSAAAGGKNPQPGSLLAWLGQRPGTCRVRTETGGETRNSGTFISNGPHNARKA